MDSSCRFLWRTFRLLSVPCSLFIPRSHFSIEHNHKLARSSNFVRKTRALIFLWNSAVLHHSEPGTQLYSKLPNLECDLWNELGQGLSYVYGARKAQTPQDQHCIQKKLCSMCYYRVDYGWNAAALHIPYLEILLHSRLPTLNGSWDKAWAMDTMNMGYEKGPETSKSAWDMEKAMFYGLQSRPWLPSTPHIWKNVMSTW